VQEKVDIVGPVRADTPSLEEMVHVAQEMERRGLAAAVAHRGPPPTNREHTAVKIAPQRSGPTIHVLDASARGGGGFCAAGCRAKDTFDKKNRAEQQQLREIHADKQRRPLVPYAAAAHGKAGHRVGGPKIFRRPTFIGRRAIERQPLDELARFIDWTFFFTAWELKGKYRRFSTTPSYGPAARDLFGAAQRLLAQIVEEGWAHGQCGLRPVAGLQRGRRPRASSPTRTAPASCAISLYVR